MRNDPVIRINAGEEFPDETPKQYIQGWVEFYKLKFKVTPDVLIPRPETELLVDEVLHYVIATRQNMKFLAGKQSLTILDLGTGSGNIIISIAKNSSLHPGGFSTKYGRVSNGDPGGKLKLFATDISEAALAIARENARKHRMQNRIFFVKSDLLGVIARSEATKQSPQDKRLPRPFGARNDGVDIIVANLPYIPYSRISWLDPSVKDFEPALALDGGPDGFDLYRKLFAQMKEKNLIPKILIAEIDDSQGKIALTEAKEYFPDAKVEVKKDLAHKQRILVVNF